MTEPRIQPFSARRLKDVKSYRKENRETNRNNRNEIMQPSKDGFKNIKRANMEPIFKQFSITILAVYVGLNWRLLALPTPLVIHGYCVEAAS